MLAVDCCRNMETSNYNGRESEDSVPSSMGAERGSEVQEDRSPLFEVDLAVDPQVQPEFGQAVQPEAIGIAKPGHTRAAARASPIIAPGSASYLDF